MLFLRLRGLIWVWPVWVRRSVRHNVLTELKERITNIWWSEHAMENLAGPSTSFCFRASVSQKLKRDRESGGEKRIKITFIIIILNIIVQSWTHSSPWSATNPITIISRFLYSWSPKNSEMSPTLSLSTDSGNSGKQTFKTYFVNGTVLTAIVF